MSHIERTVHTGNQDIANGITAIRECFRFDPLDEYPSEDAKEWLELGKRLHGSMVAYLIKSDEKNLLFDTLCPQGREIILDQLEELLEGDSLDYLVISHPEANHAGNAHAILEKYPEATLVAPERSTQHELYSIDVTDERTMLITNGDTITLGKHEVEFHEPVIYDHAIHTFMTENLTNTLFTVDWFYVEHLEGDCLKFADEMNDGNGLSYNQFYRTLSHGIIWLQYSDPDLLEESVDYMQKTINPEIIAPGHGVPIREDVGHYLDIMKDVLRQVAEEGPKITQVSSRESEQDRYKPSEEDNVPRFGPGAANI